MVPTPADLLTRQQTFGYTEEELRVILAPMARTGAEPIGSMGTDTPLATLSDKPRLVFDYFTQLFAQVTNPPLDAIREELVTSLVGHDRPGGNLLEPSPASCRQITLPFPVIGEQDLAKIVHINDDGDLPGLAAHVGGRPVRTRRQRACRQRRRAAGADRRDMRRGGRRDRRRRAAHRLVRPRPRRGSTGRSRSRRCCSPARCTIT